MLIYAAPWIFVGLWSTGYIAMKVAAPHVEPMTFLAIRFLLVTLIVAALIPLFGRTRLRWQDWTLSAAIGACLHGIYLGGIMFAIDRGMPAGVAALIISLQPILMALSAGPVFGETVLPRHWLGLACGLGGIVLVLAPKMGTAGSWAADWQTGLAAALSLAALTVGTIYQKAHATHLDLRAALLPQYAGATFVTALWAMAFEARTITWNLDVLLALVWLVVVLSLGAISLFLLLLRENAAWRTSTLFYMIPPVTAVIAWAMFGERLMLLQLVGMALVMAAVLAVRPKAAPR